MSMSDLRAHPSLTAAQLNEQEHLLVVLALARGQEPFTEEQAYHAARWAGRIKIEKALLDLVLAGELDLLVDAEGEVLVARPCPEHDA